MQVLTLQLTLRAVVLSLKVPAAVNMYICQPLTTETLQLPTKGLQEKKNKKNRTRKKNKKEIHYALRVANCSIHDQNMQLAFDTSSLKV